MASELIAKPLDPQQEKAVQLYIKLGNKTEAYKQAGYGGKSNPKTLNENACKFFADTKILTRTQQLQGELSQELKYTVKDAFAELQDAIEFAKTNGQAAAVISAIGKKIDLFGLDAPKKINIEGTFAEWLSSVQNGKMDNSPSE